MQYYENTFRKLYVIENKKINDTDFYAKVKLSPYQKGQAITVANTLRRILLNELDCIGIQSVQIRGVSHEFTVKPGIRESIPEILSNLRKLVFRRCEHQSNSKPTSLFEEEVLGQNNTNAKEEQEQKNLHSIRNQNFSIDNYTIVTFCSKSEPGRLCASDIHLPNDIQCVSPKQNIATLISTHASLDLQIVLTRSKQYAHTLPHNNMNTSASSSLKKGFEDNQSLLSQTEQAWIEDNKGINAKAWIQESGDMNQRQDNADRLPDQSQLGEFTEELSASNSKATSTTLLPYTSKQHFNRIAAETEADSGKNRTNTTPEPFLPVDTIFNPVKRVNYSIHQEVFQNTKQESIFLEIWTNGSLYPLESLARTSLLLRQMFQPFTF